MQSCVPSYERSEAQRGSYTLSLCWVSDSDRLLIVLKITRGALGGRQQHRDPAQLWYATHLASDGGVDVPSCSSRALSRGARMFQH